MTKDQRLSALQKMKRGAEILEREILVMVMAAREPRVSWGVRMIAIPWLILLVVPIQVFPESIPVFRDVGDLIVLLLGYVVTIRLLPEEVLSYCRSHAQDRLKAWTRLERIVAAATVLFWIVYTVCLFARDTR